MVDAQAARVLVTGGTGFVGSHLVRRLVAEGGEVHVTTRSDPSAVPWRLADLGERITLHRLELGDPAAVEGLVATVGPTTVFHLAAHTHVTSSWERVDACLQTNVRGTAALLGALAREGSCRRVVHVSTADVYGDAEVPFAEDTACRPVSPYAASKLAAEHYAEVSHRADALPVVVVRPSTSYGPAQSSDRVVPEVILHALRGEDVAMTSGVQTREFTYVDDLVDGLVLAASVPGVEGDVFNLGAGREVAVREVVAAVLALLGDPVEARFGARPERPAEISRMVSDSGRARARLGWSPRVDLDDGLARTAAWYRDHPTAGRSG